MSILMFSQRYCLLFYWLVFAALTLYEAQFPGLMLHPEEWRYPWGAVFVVWALLAISVGILYAILRPASFNRSWSRLSGALAYSAILLFLGYISVVTDMPGYYYVFAQFSIATMAGMLVITVFQATSALWRSRRRGA